MWLLGEVPCKLYSLQMYVFYCIYLCIHHSLCDFSHLWQDGQGVWQSILCSRLRFVTTKLTLEEEVIEGKTWYFISTNLFFPQESMFWPISKWCLTIQVIQLIILCYKVECLCNKEEQFYMYLSWNSETYQVLHLFLESHQGFPSANSKYIGIHVFIIHGYFYLLQKQQQQQNSPVRFCDRQSSMITPKSPTLWCLHPPLECERNLWVWWLSLHDYFVSCGRRLLIRWHWVSQKGLYHCMT